MRIALLALILSLSASAVTILGTSNIYGSGYGDTPAPDGGGGGTAPIGIALPAGTAFLQFTAVTGVVSCCSSLVTTGNGPDGGLFASGTTDITSNRALSGIRNDNATMFLVGVFLGPASPGAGPAPSALNFSDAALGRAFASLSPLLGQVFFIGDGKTGTGSGALQSFVAPAGATRVFLGFADAFEFGSLTNPPGFYGDNLGTLEATVVFLTPEPGTFLLSGAALAAWFLRRRIGTA